MIRTVLSLPILSACLFAAAPAVAESNPPAAAGAPAPATTTITDELGLPCDIVIAPRASGTASGPAARARKPARSVRPDGRASSRGDELMLERIERRRDDLDATPRVEGELRMEGSAVSAAAVGLVVQRHRGELEYCMTRLPRAAREGAVGLAITIERGRAAAVRLVGGPQAPAFGRCVVAQVKRWDFPSADLTTEIEYPVLLGGR